MSEARLEELKSHLETQPNDPFLYHAMGVEFIKLKDYQKAIKHFEKALETDPQYLGSYYQLGKCLEQVEQYNRALNIYMKGMNKAQVQGDRHAYSELRQAYEFLEEEIDE